METSRRPRRRRTGRALKGTARQRRGGGKGGGGAGGARYTIPKAGEALVEILFFRGLYKVPVLGLDGKMNIVELPYDIKCQHYSARVNNFLTCRAGLQEFEDEDGGIGYEPGSLDCVPCYYYFEDGKDGPISGSRKLHIFNAVLLADFHSVPGKREKKGKKGEFWPEMVRCSGRRCPHCKKGIEKTFGHRVYIPLGTNFVQNLADYDLITLSEMCQCGGKLEPVGFSCPACGSTYMDFEETPCTDEELQSLRESQHRCPACHEYVDMEEHSECDSCREPHALTMWDVALEMYRSGDGVNTSLVISRARAVSEEELAKVKDLLTPVDTTKMYPILSLKAQAEKFNLENPFQDDDRGGSRGAGDYNDTDDGDTGYDGGDGGDFSDDDIPF